jgi:ribA/ribD-fused uncharacterized protein
MNQNGNQDEPIMEFRGDNAFLSNFWLCHFEYEGIQWASVEAAYQAMKSDDPIVWEYVSRLTARDAKKYGKTINLRDRWNDMKIRIMTDIVFCKFSHNNYLKIMLLDTGDRLIVEGNRWGDQFWGVSNGHGRNELGRILMYVRDILKHKKIYKKS